MEWHVQTWQGTSQHCLMSHEVSAIHKPYLARQAPLEQLPRPPRRARHRLPEVHALVPRVVSLCRGQQC
jgi:hypothetical protein